MDKMEIIAYNLDIIGATLTLIAGFSLMLMCIVKRKKEGIRIFGILTFMLMIILLFVLLVPLKTSSSYLFGLICLIIFVVGLMELPNIIELSSIENKRKE